MNPQYHPTGDLVCGECGKPLSLRSNARGDTLAMCEDVGCKSYGQVYEIGSSQHNPAPELRQDRPVPFSPSRYSWGAANWVVKDGVKVEA